MLSRKASRLNIRVPRASNGAIRHREPLMRTSLRFLTALAASATLALPGAAFARFGKHHSSGSSRSSGSSSHSSGSSVHHTASRSGGSYSRPSSSSRVHYAAPSRSSSSRIHYAVPPRSSYGRTPPRSVHHVVQPGSNARYDYDGYHNRRYYDGYRHGGSPYYGGGYYWHHRHWYGWGVGYAPIFWGPSYPPEATGYPTGAPSVTLTLGLDGQSVAETGYPKGAAAGFKLAIEGRRAGFYSDVRALEMPAGDGTGDTDQFVLSHIHLTYALVSNRNGRLRVGAGVDIAAAPDVTFYGLGLAMSGAVGIAGPISLEGAVRAVPYPYYAVEGEAGLGLALGRFGIDAGWRATWLNDEGKVDGTVNEDLFSGPYVGISLVL